MLWNKIESFIYFLLMFTTFEKNIWTRNKLFMVTTDSKVWRVRFNILQL